MKRSGSRCLSVLAGASVSLISGFSATAGAGEVSFEAPQRLEVPGLEYLEGPELVDFDGDGVRDLLSGNYDGNLIFRKNTGTDAAPVWAKPVMLQRDGETIELRHW